MASHRTQFTLHMTLVASGQCLYLTVESETTFPQIDAFSLSWQLHLSSSFLYLPKAHNLVPILGAESCLFFITSQEMHLSFQGSSCLLRNCPSSPIPLNYHALCHNLLAHLCAAVSPPFQTALCQTPSSCKSSPFQLENQVHMFPLAFKILHRSDHTSLPLLLLPRVQMPITPS